MGDSRLQNALASLQAIDNNFPIPQAVNALLDNKNSLLLDYVIEDAFGAHVFPGNIANYSHNHFLNDLKQQLTDSNPIHLWVNLPLCEKRCFFCQFPIAITRNGDSRQQATQKWLDANLQEARLWLDAIPQLRAVPIGEFNILGGTPTLFSNKQLAELLAFYKNNFNFNKQTTVRIEGTASTYTADKLLELKNLGINKISSGIQSFNDHVLKQANCVHTSRDALAYIQKGKELGFDNVNADFIYGLLDQRVEQFIEDIAMAIKLDVACIVITKLHLKTFADVRTAVSGEKDALWQTQEVRKQLTLKGHHWPTLGEQYQMREEAVKLLTKHGYREHPTMYFYHPDKQPEKWKSLTVDQDKHFAEIGIGMGGSSSCMRSEAINASNSLFYFEQLKQGIIPLESIKGFDAQNQIKKSLQMALSSCQPLENSLFKQRFPGECLFNEPFHSIFCDLERRGLLHIHRAQQNIQLTTVGKTLIEAIIHTAFQEKGSSATI